MQWFISNCFHSCIFFIFISENVAETNKWNEKWNETILQYLKECPDCPCGQKSEEQAIQFVVFFGHLIEAISSSLKWKLRI